MTDAFLGTIIAWPIDYAPDGWAFCWGQEIQIQQKPSLYSLLGVRYGGDGRTTFNLPDLRGKSVIGMGAAPGLTSNYLGQMKGHEYANAVLPSHTHVIPNSGMSANLSTANISVTASEITVESSGTYGVPITSEAGDPASMPANSDHYLGTPKLKTGLALDTYYTSATEPTVTTKPTTINVTGKTTPTINASLTGNAKVDVTDNLQVSTTGTDNNYIPLTQPSLVLNYIICVDGLYPPRP
jgi:microcystin-dependent protein